jgi:hypothetical protein
MARANENGCTFDEQLASDLTKATASTIPSVMGFPEAPPPMTFAETMTLGLKRAAGRPSGSVFEFADLFLPAEWGRVPNTRSCGRAFRKKVESTQIATFTGRSDARHAIYIRN